MLHAFARHKSNAYKRYIGTRDPGEPRVSAEDEITSIIFGPLDFLLPSEHWKLWKLILQNYASVRTSGPLPSDFIGDFSPSESALEFWPRKDQIEPDLLIRFSSARGETRSLLVELKWDAGVSGDDQLQKQWLHYHHGEHDRSLHIFIAKHMGDLPSDIGPWSCQDSAGALSSRLRAVRWHEFRHEIEKLGSSPDTSGPLQRWCLLASRFLNQIGIRPFVGFHTSIQLAASIQRPDHAAVQFWSPAAKLLPDNRGD